MQIKYEWDFGDGSPTATKQQESHTYTAPGQYIVKLFISYCCKSPVEIKDLIVVIPKPLTDLASAFENCFKTQPDFPIPVKITNLKDLDIIYTSQLEYEWNGNNIVSGANKNTVVVNRKTDLKLKVTYYNIEPFKACPNEFKTTVAEFCPPTFVVPDVFTPNGDGTNDNLKLGIDELDSDNYFFRIYNRWGELVYFSKTLPEPNPWDGKFKGKMVEPDTFAWTVEYRSRFKPNGITYKNKGAILIAR
jgi:gliding motility-associated-like protein